jgi:type 1 glutamine amidotransferase
MPTGGMAGTGVDPMGGTAGMEMPTGGMGGMGGTGMAGMAGTGAMAGTGSSCEGPYCPRTGTFKVLAYSKTGGYRHADAIDAGKPMLTAMGTKQGFTVAFTENTADFSAENLAQYEVVFGLDPTGNNLSNAQKTAFEEWMTMKNGAFAGVHSSTDHENGWAFWSEVTGQYYDLHDTCCTQQNIQWDPAAANHPTVVGLPSPWQRSEEWYKFNQNQTWSTKPGFQVLSRVTTNNLTRPVSYVREWSNFRSFYTSLGHQGPTYSDANFIRHVAAGIMWSARREALIKP